MLQWFRTYQQVMSFSALRSRLYMTNFPDVEEAKFNAIHSTFVLMHIYPHVNEDVLSKGCSLFTMFLEKYFTEDLKVRSIIMIIILYMYTVFM